MNEKNLKRYLSSSVLMLAVILFLVSAWKVDQISGIILDENREPIPNAIVRIRATEHHTKADREGKFRIENFPARFSFRVTAWADGYYIKGTNAWPWHKEVEIVLDPYLTQDQTDYQWVPPAIEDRSVRDGLMTNISLWLPANIGTEAFFFNVADHLELGCKDCHGQVIYDQWVNGAHALGFSNPRFATIYLGTDLDGNQSPPTRTINRQDYGAVPLPPDPAKPYYGPGYKLDFPNSAGNCAACHLPSAAIDDPLATDPSKVNGVDALGAHCDYCHKIIDVRINPQSGKMLPSSSVSAFPSSSLAETSKKICLMGESVGM